MLWMNNSMGWAWPGMVLTWIVPLLLIIGLARAVLMATGPADSRSRRQRVRYAPIPIDPLDHGKRLRNQRA